MNEDFLSFILNSLPMLISYVGPDQRYQFVNQSYGTWFGLDPRKIVGLRVSDVVGEAGYAALKGHIERALAGEFTEFEIVISYRFGELKERDTRCTYVPDVGADGFVKGFVALVQDVSEMRRNERLLANQKIQMINSSKLAAIGEMAGSLAHEINNPLSIIHGRAERLKMLAQDKNLNVSNIVKTADTIESTSMRISRIVNGLRTLSRNGDNDPIERVPLAKLIDETVELSVQRFKGREIDLKVDKIDGSLEVNCRPVQISQVILNLLNNAYDAVCEMESAKWVKVSMGATGGQVLISIENNGSKIPEDIQEKIFDPFFTTKGAGKGTGLGLSISRSIIDSHGGALYLDTGREETCFVFRLPVVPAGF